MSLKPDLEITVAAAAAITERARLTGTVTGLRPLAGGQISAVYEIDLSPPAASVILKIYPNSFEWKMGKEANLYRAFQSTTLPVPRLLLVDELQNPHPAQLHRRDEARRRTAPSA